jgi:hypothetical protein
LLWIFRNFETLPTKVLSSRQQRLMARMCAQGRFVCFGMGVDDAPLLGTLEQRPPVSARVAEHRPAGSLDDAVSRFATEEGRQ